MNKTKIEWCDSTWNPVTGCLHKCEYCYARKIAQRFGGRWDDGGGLTSEIEYPPDKARGITDIDFPLYKNGTNGKVNAFAPYPFGFAPTFHRYRLDEPQRKTKAQNIFVCSMADLFGDWVPDEWIQEVFKACEAAPQHNYLFLTKNGARYEQLGLLSDNPNFWYGTTRTGINRELESGASDHRNIFLSLEPLLAPLDNETLNAIEFWNWVIIGAETGNRKSKVVPKKEWVDNITKECKATGVPVFMKDSLVPIMGEENMLREFPQELTKEVSHEK